MNHAIVNPIVDSGEIRMDGQGRLLTRPPASSTPSIAHRHADVLGVKVSAIDMERALELAVRWIQRGDPGYVCFAGVHGVMEAQRDRELLGIFNHAAMAAPDGMPMTWVGRFRGHRHMDRVFGPEFMLEMCRISVERGYRNFLYGGKLGVAERLSENLQRRLPGLQIVGTFAPPFRTLHAEEAAELVALVRQARPHILWVGLSTPKQERFMAQFVDRLEVPLLAGVGAAFDFHTGAIRDCSSWVKRAGLQWLHRLAQEPDRLWKRYLTNNPAFLWKIALLLAASRPKWCWPQPFRGEVKQ
ncbi:MAG: WecB/TagA/CpsF family glycosyltransferase [Terracidiphilus sp.]|jgi:N-acetylglucosaminyldiphosphoundecaprenol N-acetyl-beta-D-mannosaminyltransferase